MKTTQIAPAFLYVVLLLGFPWHSQAAKNTPLRTAPNPSYRDINSYIENLARDYQIPPIIIQAICWKESSWRHFDESGNTKQGPTNDFGVMQVTEQEALNFPRYSDWKDNWKTNLRLGVEILLKKWSQNGVPVSNKPILEEWYYPIAWYNGEGRRAYEYVGDVYTIMQSPPSEIAQFCQAVIVGSPRLIGGWDPGTITRSGKWYELQEIITAGGHIHRWNSEIGTALLYQDVTVQYASTAPPDSQPQEFKQIQHLQESVTGGSIDQKGGVTPNGFKALDIELPKPMFVGTPYDKRILNLEKPLGRPRPPFLAPVGTTNVALHKPVSSSDMAPAIGKLMMITDGDKEARDAHYVELGPFLQHVTVDLQGIYEIHAIVFWHYHKMPRVYSDIVVQLADDPHFITNVKTVFNNDSDNSAALGLGRDMHYVETYEGKLIDCLSQGSPKARYVRLYSRGNTANDLNHYIEVEVYGRPVSIADPPRGDYAGQTTDRFLAENKELKEAITNLTREDQLGYAKVINQRRIDGQPRNTMKFVETAREDKLKKVLEREYTIEGDVVHFDVLAVKFRSRMVIDGKATALFLWRRVYGNKMMPEEDFVIEQPGSEPQRYSGLLEALPAKQGQEFWSYIWGDLADDTEELKEYDIEAANVNVVSSRLRKGLIYVLKVSPTGQVYCETIPDI